jgi:protocatechuate 3,4-dioxygenase beta subunit
MPTYRNLASAFLCLSFLAASAPLPFLAQASFTARLQGAVLDPSGKTTGDAKVSIRNDATGTVERTVTDREGRCIFSSLQPGAYTISVEGLGFAPLYPNHRSPDGVVARLVCH